MNSNCLRPPALAIVAFAILYATCIAPAQGTVQPAIAQRTFASPAEATNALVNLAKAHDTRAICEIFGPEGTNLLTGDAALDERHFRSLGTNLAAGCEAAPEGSNSVILKVGKAQWPFPIPLIETNGAWMFNTIAGEDEVINRHIGRDEYYAIGVCRAYVKAQQEYSRRFSTSDGTQKYAQKFKSTPGRMNGLYWPAEAGGLPSPFSAFVAEAGLRGYDWRHGKGPRPFHGYLFKILTRQGPAAPGGKLNYIHDGQMSRGFALVAYPVRWGESGIMTFIVNQDGIVYQQSLGENTTKQATAMKEYNPGSGWTIVQEPGIADLTPDEPDSLPH